MTLMALKLLVQPYVALSLKRQFVSNYKEMDLPDSARLFEPQKKPVC